MRIKTQAVSHVNNKVCKLEIQMREINLTMCRCVYLCVCAGASAIDQLSLFFGISDEIFVGWCFPLEMECEKEQKNPEHNNREERVILHDTVEHGLRVVNELKCHDVNKFTSVTHAVTMTISIRENWLFCSLTHKVYFV